MLSYETALKLKEAGFPNSQNWIEAGTHFWIDKGEIVYEVPTLSELIEACGDGFKMLHRSLDRDKGVWFASSNDGEDYFHSDDGGCYGNTRDEAVANLWLELNKK